MPVDHHSFRDSLLVSIGFVIGQNRDLLRRLLREQAATALTPGQARPRCTITLRPGTQ
jgi:hypothetical protein